MSGQNERVRSQRFGAPGYRAQVVRILDMVERHQQRNTARVGYRSDDLPMIREEDRCDDRHHPLMEAAVGLAIERVPGLENHRHPGVSRERKQILKAGLTVPLDEDELVDPVGVNLERLPDGVHTEYEVVSFRHSRKSLHKTET